MKPIHIEFVENAVWRWVWLAALGLCLGISGVFVWRWIPLESQAVEVRLDIAARQQDLKKMDIAAPATTDPRRAGLVQAAHLLQQDLNKVFAAPENLQSLGIRLRSLSVEHGASVLRLEYDLASVVQASTISEALNAGYDQRPWQLESIIGVGNTPTSSSVSLIGLPAATGVPQYRGIWRVRVDSL